MTEQSVSDLDIVRSYLASRVKSGANWFFWIAAASVINSVAWLSGGDWNFVIGLGTTQFFDIVLGSLGEEASDIAGIAFLMNLALDLVIVAIFVAIGFLSRRRRWIYVTGMVLYALDGILLGWLFEDYLGVIFHLLVLYFLFQGARALYRLHALDHQAPEQPSVFSKA
jgi:hypothetical protein